MAKRRQFSREFKAQVVLGVLTGVQSQAEVCRKHTLGANLLGLWKSTFLERAHLVFDNEAAHLGRAGADRRTGAGAGSHDPGERALKKSLEQAGLTLDEKREMMLLLREQFPINMLCEVLGVPRSSAYYEPRPDEDRPLLDALIEVAGQWPTYGYRRLTKQLQREGHAVNAKRVRRLMHELGIMGKALERKPRTTDSGHSYPRYPNLVEDLKVTLPDQVWVADITYIRLRKEFVYLSVLMDVYTRCIRGWHLGRGLDQELTLVALRRAFEHGRPEIHHSDQGVQYAATAYVDMLINSNVKISMANVGEPEENGYAERLMRTIKEEEVDLSGYEDFGDALRGLGRFLDDVYNRKRIHSSLGYLTPAEFEGQWREKHSASA